MISVETIIVAAIGGAVGTFLVTALRIRHERREAFLALVDLINTEGEPGQFAKTHYRYLTLGAVDVMDQPLVLPAALWADREPTPRRARSGDGMTFAKDLARRALARRR